MTAANIQSELRTASGDSGLTVTGTTDTGPFVVTGSDLRYHTLSFVTDAGSVQGSVSHDTYGSWWYPRMCSDGTYIYLVDLPASSTAAPTIKWNKYNATMVKQGSTVDTSYSPGVGHEVGAVAAGNFDLGAARIAVLDDTSSFVDTFDTSGARQVNERFPTDSATAWLTYGDALGDGARFWTDGSVTDTPLTKHSTWTWTTASSKYWAAYTWKDTTGTTHESQISPRNSITMGRRQYLTVTTSGLPGIGGADEPNSRGIYLYNGASDPGATGFFLQDTVTDATVVLDGYDSGGDADPSSNNFPTGTAPKIQSNSGEWALSGDGTALFYTASFSGDVSFDDGLHDPATLGISGDAAVTLTGDLAVTGDLVRGRRHAPGYLRLGSHRGSGQFVVPHRAVHVRSVC